MAGDTGEASLIDIPLNVYFKIVNIQTSEVLLMATNTAVFCFAAVPRCSLWDAFSSFFKNLLNE